MFKNKVYITVIAFLVLGVQPGCLADPIVELAAPRIAPKIVDDGGSSAKPVRKPTSKRVSASKVRRHSARKSTVHVRRKVKPKPIVLDYKKIAKMIEYGHYDEADNILQGAVSRNPNDIKARALKVISLAKQSKLEPAQKELNVLLKKHPQNSNLHYAQGVVYYQRTASSNMVYRKNTPALMILALKEFKKAIALDKNNAEAYNAAGVISLISGNKKDAEAYFKKALVADKTYSLAIDNLGTMDFVSGKYADAEKKYSQALSYNSQNATAMYHMAQIGMQKKDYATALHYLNEALALNSNSPAIYNLMGKAYIAQGNDAAAINSFKKSLAVKPEFAPSYYDLADIYERRGDCELALAQLKTAVTLEPDYSEAKLKIADISLASGKYDQAIQVYSELIGVNGYNAFALKGLANAYYGQSQTSTEKGALVSNPKVISALNSINKASSLNSQDLELHLAKLRLQKVAKQPQMTEDTLQRILQTSSDDVIGKVLKGEAYLAIGDYSNAQKSFDAAMALTQSAQDDLYLAEILIYHKQFDSAQKILSKILKADATNAQAIADFDEIQKCKKAANNFYKSAQTFIKSKNPNAAIDYLNRSLDINPNNAQAQLDLAELLEKQKMFQAAAEHYKAYLGLEPNSSNSSKISKKIKALDNRL